MLTKDLRGSKLRLDGLIVSCSRSRSIIREGKIVSKISKCSRFRGGGFLPAVIITGFAFVLSASNIVMAQTIRATDVNTFVRSDVYVPKEVPLSLEGLALFRTIEDEYMFRFSAANTTVGSLSNLRFLALIVGENGNIKSGQGWTSTGGLKSLGKSEFEVGLKYRVSNGDRLVLTVYSVKGPTGEIAVPLEQVTSELSSKGLIKAAKVSNPHQSKARSNSLPAKIVNAKFAVDDNCAAALTAAAAACPCGLKSFSCDPSTGSFSFTCFSQQENPGACLESPPGN